MHSWRLLTRSRVTSTGWSPSAPHDVTLAAGVMRRYANLAIGLADASIVVLAQRQGTRDVLTLDERHFRALRTLDGTPFADA